MNELTTVAVVWIKTQDRMPTAHYGPYWIVFQSKNKREVEIAMLGNTCWYGYADQDTYYPFEVVTHWAEMDWAALPSDE